MNVHVFESDPDVERELQGQQVKFHSFPLGRETVQFASEAEVVVVFIGSRLDKEVFVALPRLRYIITRSTGYDHIDIEEAKRRGVVVSNVVGYGTVPVAEHTFALLLGLMRNVKDGDRRVRSGRWEVRGLMGAQISGKTFGVAGTGNIGSRVALLAQAFGARVIAYDAVERQDLKAAGVHYVEWTELLRESDVLSLNLPLNEATRHILDKSAILMMKPGSYIVNTGRGGLIDEEA
ncbi:MAG: NAD(P)-dependent oxidoreductase, partial [TACK group archaeon]|nr:NAD(P)-dependent oxidoreductase [TACK group archaeon]